MADLVAAARAGDRARARDLQVALNPLHRLLFVEPNPIPVKWALHLMGLFGPEIRLPLVPLGEPHATLLAAELSRLGLLRRAGQLRN
jgi:4-hydroxy-tetrahydrodipicolinate synthase